MGYWANPFDSKAGFKICQSIFEDLYVAPTGEIISDSVRRSVTNFETNFFGPTLGRSGPGATKLRVINVLYDEFEDDYAADCGIYRCQECNRVDHIFNWEFIDLSTYPITAPRDAPLSSWGTPTADLAFQPGGLYAGGAYQILAHVRCNEVSTCNACGLTFFAPESDITHCPDCGAGPADPSNGGLGMVQAGCGATGSVLHAVAPVADEQRCSVVLRWSSQTAGSNFIELRRSKSLTVKIPVPVRPRTYDLRWRGDNPSTFQALQGQTFRKRGDAMPWIPRLELTLPDGRTSSFPITLQGGYSSRSSPLYPGMFSFGGSNLVTVPRGRQVMSYLGGYRSPDMPDGSSSSFGDVDGRRTAFGVPGIQDTYMLGNTRIPMGSSSGTSRKNRRYQTDILWVNPDSNSYGNRHDFDVAPVRWDGDEALLQNVSNSDVVGVYASGVLLDRRASRTRATASDIYNELPVNRYRTFQNNARQKLNLLNPTMRDIDDHGLTRVTPIPIVPDLNIPRSLTGSDVLENKGGGSIPPCPNDMTAAIDKLRHDVDTKDALAAAIASTISQRIDGGNRLSDQDYPFGITDVEETPMLTADPDLLQSLIDLGMQIPSKAPGTGYSYIVGINRARSGSLVGSEWQPILRSSRGSLAFSTRTLTPEWLKNADPSRFEERLFYARTGGSGTRRDPTTFEPPRKVPRFGSVVVGAEVVEDPLHSARVEMPPFFQKTTHNTQALGKPYFDFSDMKIYQTFICTTCKETYTSGTILLQHQRTGTIVNLEIDPNNGVPTRWDHVPRNRQGLEEWMVGADIAFEGNRKFRTCPDPIRVSGQPMEIQYLAPDSNANTSIDDFRYDTPMNFYPESQITSIPGYRSHDSDGVDINGTFYPTPTPRESFLLGSHNSRSSPPSILARAGIGRLRSEATRPLYRRHDVDGTTLWIPVLWGVLTEGRMITTEATNLSSISDILGGSP